MKKGWPTKTLGDVCQLISGQHIDAKDYNTESRGVGYLTGPSDFGPLNPVITKWTEHPKVKAKRGDVLITVKGSGVGKINLLDEDEVAISRQLMAVRVTGAEPSFVHAILSSTFDHFQSLSTGAAIPGISREQVLGLTIALPPLAEQQRIVGLLDEAFEGLATAKANAEKNLQNARALFESHLQSVFTQRGPGWVEKSLGDVCEVFADGDWVESKDQSSEGIRLIQTGNVGEGLFKDRAEKARYISEATFKRLRCTEIFEGDCLVSRLPDPVGRSCILPDTGERMITAVDCTILRFNPKQLLPTFFNHYSQSDDYLTTVANECTGTTRNRISRSNLGLTPIPVPPLAEQQRIVAKLDRLSEETQRLARLYERKLAALEALKKSLLHKAFTGKL